MYSDGSGNQPAKKGWYGSEAALSLGLSSGNGNVHAIVVRLLLSILASYPVLNR